MPNSLVCNRIKAIKDSILSAYAGGAGLSSTTQGHEREIFINLFPSQILPPHFRFGTGVITDINGKQSGQMDVVIENPFLPSTCASIKTLAKTIFCRRRCSGNRGKVRFNISKK